MTSVLAPTDDRVASFRLHRFGTTISSPTRTPRHAQVLHARININIDKLWVLFLNFPSGTDCAQWAIGKGGVRLGWTAGGMQKHVCNGWISGDLVAPSTEILIESTVSLKGTLKGGHRRNIPS